MSIDRYAMLRPDPVRLSMRLGRARTDSFPHASDPERHVAGATSQKRVEDFVSLSAAWSSRRPTRRHGRLVHRRLGVELTEGGATTELFLQQLVNVISEPAEHSACGGKVVGDERRGEYLNRCVGGPPGH